ncbi:endonuclease-reverse transcriptase [Elysia marginata]|uniref:Endonuclease-reverse transcriptase n=1 Tax=Elysia marginata TaxID=1093978 RepID=A0AAV4JW74_9GAST|nr:endonuclease-reverse transcriptase [Elysia marginata]
MGINIGGRDITNLTYADDTALLSDNLTSMKRILHRVNNAGQQAGLLLNAKKTKVMHIPASKESSNVEPDIKIDRTSLENVDNFKYLGSIKTSDGACTRIGMAKQGMVSLNNIWKDKSIPKPLKFKLLKTLVWPRMLYGCETWTMRKADESKIEAAEMWFFRRLPRVSWKDRRTNGNVLAEMGTGRTLLSLVKDRRLKYIGHAERNTKTDLMKIIFEGKTEAKRGRGRPSISYVDQVSKATGLKLQSISQKSQDRVIWRGIVKSSCAAANINPDMPQGNKVTSEPINFA